MGAIIKRKELYFWPRVLSFLTLECHVYCDTENRFWVLNEDLNFRLRDIWGFFNHQTCFWDWKRTNEERAIFLPMCHCGLNAYIFINGIMHHTYHSPKNLLNTHQKRGNILFMSMFISYFFSSKTLLIYAFNILKKYVSLFFRWLQIRIFWS